MTPPPDAGPHLLTLLREHDLPPRWDGCAVAWESWQYAPVTTLHLHTRTAAVCEGCGNPTIERGFPCWSTAWGMRADNPNLTPDDLEHEEAIRAAAPPRSIRHKAPRHWWRTLCALRCHHCQLDTVWDTTTDQLWTLDHTDYSDQGSEDPA